jgi:SAM-dependent methyltransferase
MSREQDIFLQYIATCFKSNFTAGKLVLDVGSYDVVGNNRYLFDKTCEYHGNDVWIGNNVDLVCATAALPLFGPNFDTIVSSGCFEHDPEVKKCFKKIVELLRPGGLFAFTCASTGHPEYGTRRQYPEYSLATKANYEPFRDYYKNLTLNDIEELIPLKAEFCQYAVYSNTKSNQLYFYGIKRNPRRSGVVSVPLYENPNTILVAEYPEPVKPAEKTAENPEPASEREIDKVLSYEQLTEAEKTLVNTYLKSIGQL